MQTVNASPPTTCAPVAELSQPGTPRSPRGPVIRPDPPIWQEIFRFLRNPRKPVILAMSRPDAKKNITTLVKAYGSHKGLREIANLVLIMVGTRCGGWSKGSRGSDACPTFLQVTLHSYPLPSLPAQTSHTAPLACRATARSLTAWHRAASRCWSP